MNAKDHFIEWLRDKILRNPAEPPAAAWQEISDSLDLEDSWEQIEEELELDAVWEKVDARLQHYEYLLRFEKISQGLSLMALALLFLPLIFKPVQQDPTVGRLAGEQHKIEHQQTQKPTSTGEAEFYPGAVNKKEDNATASSSLKNREGAAEKMHSTGAQQEQNRVGEIRKGEGDAKPGFSAVPEQGVVQDKSGRMDTALSYRNTGAAVSLLEPVWNEQIADPEGIVKPVDQAPDAKTYEAYPSAYIGAGTAIKLSSLLSSKTWHAMERSSLLSSAPAWQQDIYVLYGQRLARRIFIQGDVYLQNKVGQQYQEYREGTFTTFRHALSYHSAALSLSWIRKQPAYGKIPIFTRWTGGLYSGRLRSAEESSRIGNYTNTGEYSRFHVGLQAGYEYDLLLHPRLMLSYGMFGRTDIVNIYSGTELIPSSFRKTRAASVDFRLTIRYTIK